MVHKFRHMAFLGDSLTDRDTMGRRKLFGFIPMDYLSGLRGKSPRGRFTNGFLWSDYIAAATVEGLEIERARKKENLPHTAGGNADLADFIIANDHNMARRNEHAFSLNDDLHVLYEGHRLARFYCEGGLTAHNYTDEFTLNLPQEGARIIVSTLDEKRNLLLKDDTRYRVTKAEKEATLIVEWSGANDLMTVSEPTTHEADKAVAARINNIEMLIERGYRNFILFNLPNLALTPRYARRSKDEQNNAKACSAYFNEQLAIKCAALQKKYAQIAPALFLDIFNVAGLLQEVYDDPAKYGFDKDKLTTPFTESDAFRKEKNNPVNQQKHISPSEDDMFWDDVHPTERVHDLLAVKFQEKYQHQIRFERPASQHDQKPSPEHDALALEKSTRLPKPIETLLTRLDKHAKSMRGAWSSERREKGQLLSDLYVDILGAQGDLERIANRLSSLKDNKDHKQVLQRHNHQFFDYLIGKKTTQSENLVNNLQQTINDAIQQHDCQDEVNGGHPFNPNR